MNSKQKGNIAESAVIAKLISLGYGVSIPFGDNQRYDIILDLKSKLYKIQIKYCGQVCKDYVTCITSSRLNHTTNKTNTTYEQDIDLFIFYIYELNEYLMIPINEIGIQKTIQIRRTLPKTTNGKKTWMLSDYKLEIQLSKLINGSIA